MTPRTNPGTISDRFLVGAHCALVFLMCLFCGTYSRAEAPVDRFVAQLAGDAAIDAEARELIRRGWAECDDCDGEEFLTQSLTVVFPRFRAALDAYDSDRYDACATQLAGLTAHANPFVAQNAAAYEIKSLVAVDKLTEAGQRLSALLENGTRTLAQYTYFAPEMTFLQGYCELADLRYEEARTALRAFLAGYPQASQRLSLAARQILAELDTRQPGRISDVVDLMTFSERRLKNLDSSEVVRTRQQRIIDLLDRMIQDAENKEKSSSGGGRGGGGGRGQTPSTPMQDSQLPGGSAPNAGSLGSAPKASPGEAWGAMPAATREAILQALRDSFPGRYRRLVEQYYEQLAKQP